MWIGFEYESKRTITTRLFVPVYHLYGRNRSCAVPAGKRRRTDEMGGEATIGWSEGRGGGGTPTSRRGDGRRSILSLASRVSVGLHVGQATGRCLFHSHMAAYWTLSTPRKHVNAPLVIVYQLMLLLPSRLASCFAIVLYRMFVSLKLHRCAYCQHLVDGGHSELEWIS